MAVALVALIVVVVIAGISLDDTPASPGGDGGLNVPAAPVPTVPPVTPGTRNDCGERSLRCLVDAEDRIVSVSDVACPNRVSVLLRDATGRVVSRPVCGMMLGDGTQLISDESGAPEVFEATP